jgi:DNA-binding NarL/FixJ family response regulator
VTLTRILLVDDHEVLRVGLRALLAARAEWEVCGEAADGREAVRLAELLRPDVVVTDLGLPELNGLEAIRQIRRQAPDTEILVFTVNDSEQIMRQALQAGARGYVLKSEAKDHLLAAVETLARHRPYFGAAAAETVLDGFLRAGAPDAAGDPLTAREREIVQLLAEGKGNRAIAETLAISVKTVDGHRTAVMRKLGARSLADVVRYAIRNGLAQP